MHQITIEIEVAAFERAREALGTVGYKETLNEALRVVGSGVLLRRGAAAVRFGALGLVTPEELEAQRRSRI